MRTAAYCITLGMLMFHVGANATADYNCIVQSINLQYYDPIFESHLSVDMTLSSDSKSIVGLSLVIDNNYISVPKDCLTNITDPDLTTIYIVGSTNGTYHLGFDACASYEPGQQAESFTFFFSRAAFLYRYITFKDNEMTTIRHDRCYHDDLYQCPFAASASLKDWPTKSNDAPTPQGLLRMVQQMEAGDLQAPYFLGVFATIGIMPPGVPRDKSMTVKYYSISAVRGYPPATLTLSRVFASEPGWYSNDPPNYMAAYYWAMVSGYLGLREACSSLFEYYYKMPKEEVDKATALFQEWQKTGCHSSVVLPHDT